MVTVSAVMLFQMTSAVYPVVLNPVPVITIFPVEVTTKSGTSGVLDASYLYLHKAVLVFVHSYLSVVPILTDKTVSAMSLPVLAVH